MATSRTIILTGAASGIGAAIAEYLLKMGHQLYLCDIDLTQLERRFSGKNSIAFMGENSNDIPNKCHLIKLDVSDSNAVRDFAARLTADGVTLWAVISNASISTRLTSVLRLDEAKCQQIMAVNCFGSVYLAKYLAPLLIKSKGRFIMTGSSSARVPSGFKAGYEMSKAALQAFAHGLRLELEPYGVLVCLIEPGGVQTDLLQTIFPMTLGNEGNKGDFAQHAIHFATENLVQQRPQLLKPEQLIPAYDEALFNPDPPRQNFIAAPTEREFFEQLSLMPLVKRDSIIRQYFYDHHPTEGKS